MYIKDNQEKISGLTAIDHMVKGKLTYSPAGVMRRINDNKLELSYDGILWEESRMLLAEYLSPNNEWYAEPVFDVREELLKRPGKWVAKYYSEDMDRWEYIGFDTKEMSIVAETDINAEVSFIKSAWLLNKHDLNKAVPLDQSEELALNLK
ncbi:hypothetical protein [Exiguobacterium sp. s133]|uniref:hypothetical protein n=1 Tax=Exiguobacterium sp. s133 TaxID=2751213 RepID=UPI001BE9AB1A|nr:hypothetical protein [Exiguobacterium sp. s133]